MSEWFSSRRDRLIVAQHEVPGKRPSKEPFRRLQYDRAQLIPQAFLLTICAVVSLGRLNTLLERFASDDVRAPAQRSESSPLPSEPSDVWKSLMDPSQ